MSADHEQRAMYLQGPCPSLFAILHAATEPRKETAVLLCPPFGWEDMCSYRIRREWAEQLARSGHATLRLDLPGSGDSAGASTDPGQLDAWTQAVDGAARWLRGAADARRVAVIGIGIGGIVSCRAALQGSPIDELVLWSVPAQGRTLLRELRTFSKLEVANLLATGERPPPDEPTEEGTLVASGYMLSAETVLSLERLALSEMEPAAHTTLRRALLLGRDGLKVDRTVVGAIERTGAEVTVADGPGFGAMMTEAQDARAPTQVIELVSSWLERAEPLAGPSIADRATRRPSAAPPAPTGELREQDELLLDHSGVALRERPVFIDGPAGRLFGVLTEPLVDQRRELTAVLLNAGPQRRTGPNRMWVEIARRWAARGVPSLRFDADGIGDSDGNATVLARVTAFYRPVYVEQARTALEMLAARGLPPRFVMLGLCSGAYWSAQAALADRRVEAVIMLNPRTLVFDEWRHTVRRTRQLRENALRASTWRKVLRGEIKLAKHLETGRSLVRRAASPPTLARQRLAASPSASRAAREPTAREPVEELFDDLRDRGQRALLLFTGAEVLRRELTEKGVLDRIGRWPNMELALMGTSADTHTLSPLWLQRQVHDLVDRVLDAELARLDG